MDPFLFLITLAEQLDQMAKTRQILDPKIREIDWSYLCLEQFDKFWVCSAGHDRKRKLFEHEEFCRKNLWNHFCCTYFQPILAFWNPLCAGTKNQAPTHLKYRTIDLLPSTPPHAHGGSCKYKSEEVVCIIRPLTGHKTILGTKPFESVTTGIKRFNAINSTVVFSMKCDLKVLCTNCLCN